MGAHSQPPLCPGWCRTHHSVPPHHPAGAVLSGEVYAVLLAENRRLREELARPPQPSPPVAPRPQALPVRAGRGMEPWHTRK